MRFAVAIALVAACASPPAVALQLTVQPAAIAFLPAGDSTWRAVTELDHSERSAIFEVPDEDGTLAITCTNPEGAVQVEELLATAGEFGSAFYTELEPWPQLGCGPADPPTTLVAGNMDQGGEVYIGSNKFGSDFSNWAFAGPVTAGIHDVVAMSGVTVLIRHDQAMLSTYAEPVIDITQGSDLDVEPFAPSSDENDRAETELATVNGTELDLPSYVHGVVYLVPDEELEVGDTQIVIASFGDESYGYFLPPLGGLGDLATPTVNAAIQLDPPNLAADLAPLALDSSVSQVRLAYASFSAIELDLAATATARWLALHGPELAIDTSFPDFQWSLGESEDGQVVAIDREPAGVLATYIAP